MSSFGVSDCCSRVVTRMWRLVGGSREKAVAASAEQLMTHSQPLALRGSLDREAARDPSF